MRRVVPTLVVIVGIVALAFWLKGNTGSPTSPTLPVKNEDYIPKLKKWIADHEVESAQAVTKYAPARKINIHDVGSPVVDLLRSLPGVVQVEVSVAPKNPTSRIVHLRDWHFVPKDLYALDMKATLRRELSADEIDRLHQELLLEVELVQIEQMAILRCLIKHHGLKRVFSEGFSPKEVEGYREKIAVLKAMDQEQVPQVREQLEDVRKLVKRSTGERKEKAQDIEAQLLKMLDDHKHRLLEMGATGRLLIAGELEEVLPLDDAEALEKASPVSPSGGVRLDPGKLEARHDTQVRASKKEGPVAVIVLGGSHDLSASIRRLDGNFEYLRVTTKRISKLF